MSTIDKIVPVGESAPDTDYGIAVLKHAANDGDIIQSRGLCIGSSMLSTPFIINTWFSGKIVDALEKQDQWRWGYGMFAITMTLALGPAVAALIWLDRMAKKKGVVNIASSNATRRTVDPPVDQEGNKRTLDITTAPVADTEQPWTRSLKMNLEEIDALCLSLFAMMIVGGLLPIAYVFFEMKLPEISAASIGLPIYIAKPWSYQDWVYYGNTLTLALCIAGQLVGLAQHWTHLYELIQVAGLCIKIIGIGIRLDGRVAAINTGALVMSSILVGIGGSMSVVGSRVASQASIPHQNVALVVSLLSLWSKIGSAIGSAIVAVIWPNHMPNQMPKQLRKYLPEGTPETTIKKRFGDTRSIRNAYGFDHPIRSGAITAYRHALYYCITVALALAFVPIVAAFFQTDYQQNAVTDEVHEELNPKKQPLRLACKVFQETWACVADKIPILLYGFAKKSPRRHIL
ncbi:hypothetical protein J3F83DRAFT_710605 [Trichoderma novae-zelandiae]